MKSVDQKQKIGETVLRLLARRDHSVFELRQKLLQRGFEDEAIQKIIAELVQKNLLNESRFAESYVRLRASKGYGPLRISQELEARGVPKTIIHEALQTAEIDWREQAEKVFKKKFRKGPSKDLKEKAAQIRFMQYRGFTGEQIKFKLNL